MVNAAVVDASLLAQDTGDLQAPHVPRDSYTIAETAWAIGVSEWIVKRLITKGVLTSAVVDGRPVVPLRAIHKLLGF